MPNSLVECIPNFSEARRPEVVDAIYQAIAAVAGVKVLDRHSDLDHNRTVITFVGSPAAVQEAAFQGIARASQLIDLNQHSGEHPRIGATDVVPFVPISDVTMTECVEMAKALGGRVAKELNIPVYLYEEAALRPDRQNLENIRKGQYEGLKEEVKTNPSRVPDFGPAELGPAGATVIGARQPLIAFNAYLTTSDVAIAQKIAKTIRHSSGGLRFVKAMGVLVEGRAQVSMNLTNYRQTPIARVLEMIRREASHYGVAIERSELVGLIPQEALINASKWYLQLDDLESNQILENRLYEGAASTAPAEGAAQPEFLEDLAAGTATPGGGSAAAFSGAAAAALVAMVARLTVGKKKYAEVELEMAALRDQAEALRAGLTRAIDQDAAAFNALMTATKLPKDTPEHLAVRAAAVELATLQAAQVPLTVAEKAVSVLELALVAASRGNLNAISDAGSAAALARASLTGAGLNVRINTLGMETHPQVITMLARLAEVEQKALETERKMHSILKERGNLPLPD